MKGGGLYMAVAIILCSGEAVIAKLTVRCGMVACRYQINSRDYNKETIGKNISHLDE